MESDYAVKIEHVYKDFKLPHEKADTIKSAFTGILKGKKGRTIELQHALHDIDFEIKKGEFFGIVGRNGSGKSTLLKIIAGIYQPTKGKIGISGRLVPFIELGVGFSPELTGRENVYLNGALMGFSTKEVDQKYQKIVDFAEIEKFMDQKLKNYSSGMQVRLAFSVATILANSDILLIDEVLAVGDADFQRKCFRYFKQLKKDKKTVVFVTHDMNAVREYCDRALLIEKSKMLKLGEVNEIATEYIRMFSNSEEAKRDNGQDRWGNGIIKLSSPKITPSRITDDTEKITLSYQAKANKDIINPIFGFTVKSLDGKQILGTNNKIIHKNIDKLIKDESITINWNIPNVFNDGEFLLDIAAIESDGTPCDWREDISSFYVFKDTRTPYIVAPNVTLDIER